MAVWLLSLFGASRCLPRVRSIVGALSPAKGVAPLVLLLPYQTAAVPPRGSLTLRVSPTQSDPDLRHDWHPSEIRLPGLLHGRFEPVSHLVGIRLRNFHQNFVMHGPHDGCPGALQRLWE